MIDSGCMALLIALIYLKVENQCSKIHSARISNMSLSEIFPGKNIFLTNY